MDEVIYSFNFNILNIFIILPQQTSWWWGTWQPESVWIVGPVRVLPLWTGENCKAVRIRRLLQHKPNYCPFPLEETDTLEWCWISILSPHSKREIKFHLVTIKEHKLYLHTLQPEGNFSVSSHLMKSGQPPLCSSSTILQGLRMTLHISCKKIMPLKDGTGVLFTCVCTWEGSSTVPFSHLGM